MLFVNECLAAKNAFMTDADFMQRNIAKGGKQDGLVFFP